MVRIKSSRRLPRVITAVLYSPYITKILKSYDEFDHEIFSKSFGFKINSTLPIDILSQKKGLYGSSLISILKHFYYYNDIIFYNNDILYSDFSDILTPLQIRFAVNQSWLVLIMYEKLRLLRSIENCNNMGCIYSSRCGPKVFDIQPLCINNYNTQLHTINCAHTHIYK
eukprot:GHVR01166371.1.p1 GENE.GHVR01166371.1~~GHVR01166371.1.p1  ORF type:complete len:169 (-),score=27.14 GHVR01166371.1:132-638(-)